MSFKATPPGSLDSIPGVLKSHYWCFRGVSNNSLIYDLKDSSCCSRIRMAVNSRSQNRKSRQETDQLRDGKGLT